MTDVLPTTVRNLERTDRSPCCDAQLELSSPPDGYECRECGERYDIDDSGSDEDAGTCDEILKSGDREGEPCGRDLPCRFHSEAD